MLFININEHDETKFITITFNESLKPIKFVYYDKDMNVLDDGVSVGVLNRTINIHTKSTSFLVKGQNTSSNPRTSITKGNGIRYGHFGDYNATHSYYFNESNNTIKYTCTYCFTNGITLMKTFIGK